MALATVRTPEGTTAKGSLTIERLDREAGLVSLQWAGELEKTDAKGESLGTGRVSGTITELPLVVAPAAR